MPEEEDATLQQSGRAEDKVCGRRLRSWQVPNGARFGAQYGAQTAATDARRATAGVSAARSNMDSPRYYPSRRAWHFWGLGNIYRPAGDPRLGSGI